MGISCKSSAPSAQRFSSNHEEGRLMIYVARFIKLFRAFFLSILFNLVPPSLAQFPILKYLARIDIAISSLKVVRNR
jgi:hypothetical protein